MISIKPTICRENPAKILVFFLINLVCQIAKPGFSLSVHFACHSADYSETY